MHIDAAFHPIPTFSRQPSYPNPFTGNTFATKQQFRYCPHVLCGSALQLRLSYDLVCFPLASMWHGNLHDMDSSVIFMPFVHIRLSSPCPQAVLLCSSFLLMVWYGMVWYGMVWYGMVWYGMVWYGMVWYGMVWYGMVWYGMVWYGTL